MENTTNNTYPADITDLLDEMQAGKYKHLQLFLYRNHSSLGLGLGQQYLVANRDDFGVYKLISVDYNNGIVTMVLTNHFTDEPSEISLNVNDEHPEYIFICWNDIKDLVCGETTSHYNGEELLELENE